MLDEELLTYDVEESHITDEHWNSLFSSLEKKELPKLEIKTENRHKEPAIPENPSQYLNSIQMESINKLEEHGWQLFFIRRSNLDETLTIMHFPKTGMTALIEKDGTINTAHDVYIRK